MEIGTPQLQIKPSRNTFLWMAAICIFFAIFSFFDLGPFSRGVGEIVYSTFLPATILTELLVRGTESPLSYIALPIFVVIESFIISYLLTIIARVLKLLKK